MKSKNARFKSVKEMVRKTSTPDEQEFIDEFERLSAERQIIKHIMGLRAAQGKSQADMAKSMDCTQSRISKLEADTDDNLRIGDLHGYLAALGFDLRLVVTRRGIPISQIIKIQWNGLLRSLKHLSGLCGDDLEMNREVVSIHQSLTSEFLSAVTALSHKAHAIVSTKQQPTEIEVFDTDPLDSENRDQAKSPDCLTAL